MSTAEVNNKFSVTYHFMLLFIIHLKPQNNWLDDAHAVLIAYFRIYLNTVIESH